MLPEPIAGWIAELQAALFQSVVLPLLHAAGLLGFADEAFDGTETFVIGVIEIALMIALLAPLERLMPREAGPRDARQVRVDVIYTLLHRLGLFPLFFFVLLTPAFDSLEASLRMHGFGPFSLESMVPALAASPLASFFVYLVVLDFAQYWVHRAQHRFGWWWALHALHHSQRTMTFWSDNRNHLLDSVITDALFVLIALVIGVPPEQFVLLIVATRFIESLSHANVRLAFGRLGERLLVGPLFHRMHHAIAASPRPEAGYHGANYAVLLPVWDMLFGTTDFTHDPGPTGIEDQLAGRDYGEGFWSQQWLGVKRLVGRG